MTCEASRHAAGFPLPRERARERGDERRAHGSFSEELSQQRGDSGGDNEGLELGTRAEVRRLHLIAHEAEQAARERRHGDESGRPAEAVLRLR